MRQLEYYFGMRPLGAVAVVASTALLYLAFAGLLRWYGQRLFASASSFAVAIATVLGAVVGRATLGPTPTLAGGLLALGTLFVIGTIVGRIRRSRPTPDSRHRAIAVMVNGEIDRDALRSRRVDEVTVWSALRSAGVRNPAEVALVILEATGQLAVIRAGEPIHPTMLTGVRYADTLRERVAVLPGS